MGTLPDLETQTAGHVAFYNLIEQAGLTQESLTWSDVVNNGNVTDYKEFDNGVILDYSDEAFGTIKIRCKTDGWVVAYTGWDGSVNTGSDSKTTKSGACLTYSDISSTNSIKNNRLVNAMEDIMNDLPDWNLANYSSSGVGIYDFTYGSDGISHFFESISGPSDATRTISKTSTTDVQAVHVIGRASAGYVEQWTQPPAEVTLEGSTLAEQNGYEEWVNHGHADATTSMETNGSVQMGFTNGGGDNASDNTGTAIATAYWIGQ